MALKKNEHLDRAKKETMESKLRRLMIENRELLPSPLTFFGKSRGRSPAGVDGGKEECVQQLHKIQGVMATEKKQKNGCQGLRIQLKLSRINLEV